MDPYVRQFFAKPYLSSGTYAYTAYSENPSPPPPRAEPSDTSTAIGQDNGPGTCLPEMSPSEISGWYLVSIQTNECFHWPCTILGAPIPVLTNRKCLPIVDKKCALDRLGRFNRARPLSDHAQLERHRALLLSTTSKCFLFIRTRIGAPLVGRGDHNHARPVGLVL